jgi:glyceraldehyde 3-phosphate dehydrogenase
VTLTVARVGQPRPGWSTKVIAVRDPDPLPWKGRVVDMTLECTGIFAAKDKMLMRLTAEAKRVLVSGSADDADMAAVYGNHDKLTTAYLVVSNGFCTNKLPGSDRKVAQRNRRHR